MSDELDLRDLRYFEVIAQTGHVGRAAARLHRSQPALTGSVRRLESALGTALFEKAGRGIRLTAAGLALAERARALRVATEDTIREIGELGAGSAGHVRIGVLPTLARFLMPPLCREFLHDAPRVTLKTVIAQNDVLAAQLEAGDVDLIVTTVVRAAPQLVHQAVLEDEAVVIASRAHPIFRRRRIGLSHLLDYPWVLAPSSVGTRQWIEQVFRAQGLPTPQVQIETNLILMMPSLIHQTELLTFTSRRHAGPDARSPLREVRLRETTMSRQFAVVYRRDGYLSPAAKRLVALLVRRGRALFAGE